MTPSSRPDPGTGSALQGRPSVISLTGVTRRFGERAALDDLTLDVPEGAIAVLLGPNGAGKTTAIRVVTGALPASSGTVRVLGMDPIPDGEPVRRRCGVVSAKPALYDRLSGRDNLAFAAELYGLGRRAAHLEATAARFGIAGALDDLVGGYSTGMKTRLALARAVLHDPDLLLLDEPTSGLDPESSVAVLDLVRGLARDGKTVLLCTHLLLEAEGLADLIVVMDQGRCIESGAPADLMRKHWPESEVRIVTDRPLDATLLATLPAVRGCAADDSDRRGTPGHATRVRLTDEHAVKRLVAHVCAAGVGVLEVVPHRPSLEDLYFASRGVRRGEMTQVQARSTTAVAATTGGGEPGGEPGGSLSLADRSGTASSAAGRAA